MAKMRLALIIATLVLLPGSRAASAETFLTFDSQLGDFIGQGINKTWTPADGTFSVGRTFRGAINVNFNSNSPSTSWSLSFESPDTQELTNKDYEGAQRFGFHPPTLPGMDIHGNGRGCSRITGRFFVSHLTLTVDGRVERLGIDFEQHCEGGPAALFGSIRFNSDAPAVPRVSVGDILALKGNAGVNDGTVTISLCLPSPDSVTVEYSTEDGTAIAGTDYVTSTGTVTFDPGITAQSIAIPIIGNRFAQGNTYFSVRLTSLDGAPLGQQLASVNILDPNVPLTALSMYGQPGDFIGPGLRVFTSADATFSVRRNSSQGVTIRSQGFDFWSLNFVAPGRVPLIPGAYENARRYLLQPPDAPGLDVSGAGRACTTLTGRFDVLDASYLPGGDVESFAADFEQHCDGSVPALFGSFRFNSNLQQFSVSNAVIDTVNSTAVFTVTMNPPPDVLASVDFRTADGDAVAAIDYVATSRTITFAIGEDEQSVTVPLINPSALEAKTFFGQLSAPSGAAIWIARGSASLAPPE